MTDIDGFHENLIRKGSGQKSTDRSFGIVFSVVFVIVAIWPLWRGNTPYLWAFGVAFAFLAAAVVKPQILSPLNRVWLGFGELLHRIVSPLAMGLIFFVAVTPIGLIMRLIGKRPIPLFFERDADSYWVERKPPGPAPESIKNQF